MEKTGLKITAGVLAGLMGLVWVARFDDLPRDVKSQIAAERSAVAGARKQVAAAKDEVARDLSGESVLFHALPSAALYNDRLSRSGDVLASASRDMERLEKLEKANRRTDEEEAKRLLAHARQARASAVTDAESVRKDADHWVELKKHLPEEVRDMERDYQSLHSPDLAALTAVVQKAQTDWPEKKADLQVRLDNVRDLVTRGDESWQASAAARQAAATNQDAKVDYGALFAAADTLKTNAAGLPAKTAELKALTNQLYESWDKLLVDQQNRKGEYQQKLRTVRTRDGNTNSEEKWVDVSKQQYQAMERNLGMAIEHKGTGKYDSEAERVAQPAGFAYMAPPGQRNQYGYWDHSGGHDFWVFYGQYALMRDLLFNRDYRPLDRYEYEDYRNYRQRNQTYYGRDDSNAAPKYGTQGTTTQNRYSGSTFAQKGGFKDSKYASKPGGYRDSEYSTPAMRNPGGDSNGRTFGNGPSRSTPRVSPAPSRPAPRPSMPRSSPGRTFGSGSRRR
jgi:hypothetical protein